MVVRIRSLRGLRRRRRVPSRTVSPARVGAPRKKPRNEEHDAKVALSCDHIVPQLWLDAVALRPADRGVRWPACVAGRLRRGPHRGRRWARIEARRDGLRLPAPAQRGRGGGGSVKSANRHRAVIGNYRILVVSYYGDSHPRRSSSSSIASTTCPVEIVENAMHSKSSDFSSDFPSPFEGKSEELLIALAFLPRRSNELTMWCRKFSLRFPVSSYVREANWS